VLNSKLIHRVLAWFAPVGVVGQTFSLRPGFSRAFSGGTAGGTEVPRRMNPAPQVRGEFLKRLTTQYDSSANESCNLDFGGILQPVAWAAAALSRRS
jgi:hypothetical protein